MKGFWALLFLFTGFAAWGQEIPVGEWRLHPTYQNAQTLALAGDRVYCASENGLFFYENDQVQTLTKLDGLSDSGIARLLYHAPSKTLCILYRNGNLDFFKEEEIVNVRTLLLASRANKQIADAVLQGNMLWIATGFGGISIDLGNFSIKEYVENLGGSTSEGRAIAIHGDSLFLATNNGLFVASLAPQANRQDWQQWRKIAFQAKSLGLSTDGLYALASSGKINRYQQGNMQEAPAFSGKSFHALSVFNGIIAGLGTASIQVADGTTIAHELLKMPMQAIQDGANFWIADTQAGLLRLQGGEGDSYFPSGPFSPQSFEMEIVQGKLIALAGGYQRDKLVPYRQAASFYIFEEGTWENYTSGPQAVGAFPLPDAPDLNCMAAAGGTIYMGSYGKGVLAFDMETKEAQLLPQSPAYTTGLSVDAEGKLWACAIDGGIYVLEGTEWVKKHNTTKPVAIRHDVAGNLWVRLADANLLVLGNGKQRFFVHDKAGNGLRGKVALSMAQSRDESIWIGTDDGISEFFDPFSLFSGGSFASVYGINGLPLLQAESVTALAFDGGGYVWIGTANGGVWRYSMSGRTMEHFRQSNSPLPSDEIQDIAVHPRTGEVFFATPLGIASYRGTATAANANQPAIFPNPVPFGFDGMLSVAGLPEDAKVKIADIAGRVVWQGQAQGGTAAWGLNDSTGQRIQPGVYLVFASDRQGVDTFVGKFMVSE